MMHFLERLTGGFAYFFAGVGLALCGFLALSLAFYSPELIPYLLVWAKENGWAREAVIFFAFLLVALGAVIGRRLASGRDLW